MISQYRWYFRESDQALQALQHHQGLSGRDLFLGSCASGMLVSPSSVYEWAHIWVTVPPNSCRFHFSRFLWSQAGDKITITFDPAVALTSFRLVSGNAEHPSDRFFNTTIEVPCLAFCMILICLQWTSLQVMSASPGKQEFQPVGSFDQFGLAEGSLPPSLGPLAKLRLNLHSSSANWAILSEIFLKRASWD